MSWGCVLERHFRFRGWIGGAGGGDAFEELARPSAVLGRGGNEAINNDRVALLSWKKMTLKDWIGLARRRLCSTGP